MRVPYALLILLVLALLVGGLWLALHGAIDPGEDRGALTREPVEELAPGTPEPLEPAAPRGTRGKPVEAGPRTALEGTAPEEEPPRAALAAERRVRGRVVDERAAPIEGATVFWAAAKGSGGMRIDRLAGARGWVEVVSTSTDSAGGFELVFRHRDDVRLAVRAAGFAPLRVVRALEATGETRLDDLVMVRGVTLSGHVVDRAGKGIEGAELLELELPEGGFHFDFVGGDGDPLARTDAFGAFSIDELAAGPYRLRVHHPDHPDLYVDGTVERPGQVVGDLRFVLEDGAAISGSVLGLEPGQHERFEVRAVPTFDDALDPVDSFASHRLAAIAPGGGFQVCGLRGESTYRLTVIDAGAEGTFFAEPRSSVARARGGETGVILELREPFSLTFAVVDDRSGEPVTAFEVEAGQPFLAALRDEAGKVVREHAGGVVRYPDVSVPAGQDTTDLRVRAEGYETVLLEDVVLESGAERDLGVIRLHAVPTLRVRVVDAATAEPVAGARVAVGKAAEGRRGPGSFRMRMNADEDGPGGLSFPGEEAESGGVTDETGLAEVSSLPGVCCEVAVSHRDYAEYRSAPVTLPAASGFEVEARLLRGGTVIVTVLDSKGELLPKARITRRGPGDEPGTVVLGWGPARSTGADGRATFRRLDAGTHRFSLADEETGGSFFSGTQLVISGLDTGGGAGDGVDVVVGEGTTDQVTLRAKPRGSLRGEITEAGQPLAGASLSLRPAREGDDAGGLFLPGFGGERTARADSRGRYELEDLKAGDYVASIGHPSRAMESEFEVTLREGESERDFPLEVTILEGRVTDSAGRPVEGIEVRPRRKGPSAPRRMVMISSISTDGGGGAMSFSAGGAPTTAATTDREGRYSIRGVAADVEVYAETRSDHYQTARSEPVRIAAGETRRGVDVEVYEAGSISLSVQNADGTPAPYAMARLAYLDDEVGGGADPRNEFVGESGRIEITSLRPGRWRITVTSSDLTGQGQEVEAPPVEVVVLPGEAVEALSQLPR